MSIKKIKKDTSLRKAILQAAITGQLISNVEGTTESGKQFLDRIIEERNAKLLAEWKEKLKDNPKTKKPTPIVASEIAEEEIPFEIPENWCWCRLGDICKFLSRGKSPKYSEVKKYPVFAQKCNLKDGEISLEQAQFLDPEVLPKWKEDYKIQDGDVLVNSTGTGTVMRTRYFKSEYLGNYPFVVPDSHVTVIRTLEIIDSKYIYYCCIDSFTQNYWEENLAGSTNQKELYIGVVGETLIPLPPLAIQNAIVAKLEEVLPLVDAYENAVLQKEELKAALPDTLKKAILQEAIQGKLTESWRKTATVEENGKQLLDRIIEERNAKLLAEWEEKLKDNPKAKKPAPIVASEIDEDEILFEIPENWCWCRLGEICNEIKRGKSPKYADKSEYLAFAQKCNVKTGGIDLGLALYLDEKSIEKYSETDNLIQSDIVINSTGGGTMGRVGLYETKVPDGIKGVYPDSHVTVIRSIGSMNQHYLYYVLKHNQPTLEKCGAGSTNQTELKPSVLENLILPLPPLAEQKKIVEILEQMLPLCENLGG